MAALGSWDNGQSRQCLAHGLCGRMTRFEWLTGQFGQRRVDLVLVPIEEHARDRPMLVVSRTRAEDLQTVTRCACRMLDHSLGGSRDSRMVLHGNYIESKALGQ